MGSRTLRYIPGLVVCGDCRKTAWRKKVRYAAILIRRSDGGTMDAKVDVTAASRPKSG